MQTREREKESRDSIIVMLLILLFGFVCILLSSGWALRFAPNWWADSNMGSNLNPDSDFLTSRPVNFLEPLDPSILTDPAWIDVFLTPGATFSTGTPLPTSTIPPIATKTATVIAGITNFPTNTPSPTNTLVYFPPPSATTKPPPPPPPATATSPAPPPSADLAITKTDNATDYAGGISVQYTIAVSNADPSNVTGATVADTFSSNLDPLSITWTCVGSGGASCTAGGSGNIGDTVNLPVSSSITYTVNATVIASPSGTLDNTATVTSAIDPNPLNNSATDTDQLIIASSFPYGQIGIAPDTVSEPIAAGTYIILQFGTPLIIGAPDGYDLVYYPDPAALTLQVDAVILQIGNGSNWYTILNWGNGSPDGNTDIPYPMCSTEADNCVITPALLTNSPGISIQLDGVVPSGSYPYIRIISPPNPPDTSNDGVAVDAITVLP